MLLDNISPVLTDLRFICTEGLAVKPDDSWVRLCGLEEGYCSLYSMVVDMFHLKINVSSKAP